MGSFAQLDLQGPRGEPVDLWRTLVSHGLTVLPPLSLERETRSARLTISAPGGPRTIRVSAALRGDGGDEARGSVSPRDTRWAALSIADSGPRPTSAMATTLSAAVRRMLCLDDDLSGFYALCATDPELAWARRGAGRLLRSPTVFEDVVKTVCTTNCAWSATERMVGALVGRLGEAAPGAQAGGPGGRAFPTPEAMANAGTGFYRDVARAGYRARSLQTIAESVAAGDLDLEELLPQPHGGLDDDEVERRLLELPGVGPYAAAHVMMLLGRHSRLVLDSWTRPKYARLRGGPPGRLVSDRTIARHFRRYGEHAGLAFWLVLTRDWVDDQEA